MIQAPKLPKRKEDALNVLIVSPVAFVPDSQGSRKRVHQMVDLMEEMGFCVHFLFVRRNDQTDADIGAMSTRLGGRFIEVRDEKPPGMLTPWFFMVRVASKLGLYRLCNIHADAWYFDRIGKTVRQLIADKKIHVVLVEYPFYAKAFDQLQGVLKILDMHDVFADRYKEFLRNGKKPFPWYSITSFAESRSIARADIVLAIQDGDAKVFKEYGHPKVLSLAYVPEPTVGPVRTETSILRLCFLGTGNFFNIRALEHYLAQIHPVLLASEIKFEFVVIGAVCKAFHAYPLPENVALLGRVDDLEKALYECDALVNPLSSGTGLPIKVLDALASGLHVLATDAGARGVPVRDSLQAVSICTDNESWVNAVRKLSAAKRDGVDLRAVAHQDLACISSAVDKAKAELRIAVKNGFQQLGIAYPQSHLDDCVEAKRDKCEAVSLIS